MTKLTELQQQKLDELIANKLAPALEDICVPNMEGVSEQAYPYVFCDRAQVLHAEAKAYIKANL